MCTHTHAHTQTNLCTHLCRSSQKNSTSCGPTRRRRPLSWRGGRRSWQHDWRCTRNWRGSWMMWSCRPQRVGAHRTQGMCAAWSTSCTPTYDVYCILKVQYVNSCNKHCTYVHIQYSNCNTFKVFTLEGQGKTSCPGFVHSLASILCFRRIMIRMYVRTYVRTYLHLLSAYTTYIRMCIIRIYMYV